jgi:hypothetical protein
MRTVKKVGVMSLAKVMGIIYGALGLIFIPFALIFAAASAVSGEASTMIGGMVGAIVIAVLAPFIYGCMGFISGALIAWLYNLIAGKFGGLELQVE